MKSSLRSTERSVSILFSGDLVKTPFISNMFSIVEEPQYNFHVGELYELSQATRLVVDVTKSRFLAADDLIQQLNLYALRGAKIIHINGGSSISQGRSFVDVLEIVKEFFPVRICGLGLKPNLAERLLPHVEGFCVDLKFAPKESYTDVEVEFYQLRFKINRPIIDYVLMMEKLIGLVDGLKYTYYTSSIYKELSRSDRERVNKFLCHRKSPFLINGFQVHK